MPRDNKRLLSIIGLVLRPILRALTPRIEEEMEDFIVRLHMRALETENEIDDMFTGLLLDLFDIPRPEGG